MNKRNHTVYLRDKQNLETRWERKQYTDQTDPMFKDSISHYEISERTRVALSDAEVSELCTSW